MGGENCAWGSGTPNVRASVNAINHTFVRTVRETGGNNARRWLCIPCFWWDNNYLGSGDEYFALFDGEKLTCRFPAIVEALTKNRRTGDHD